MPSTIHPDLLFPAEPEVRPLARALYAAVKDLPIVSPHGHTDPRWYAENEPFPDPAQLLIVPDHYIFRMLFSQGVRARGPRRAARRRRRRSRPTAAAIWRRFAENYHLFRGTPTRLWLDHTLRDAVRHRRAACRAETADAIYDQIADCLAPTPSSGRARCSSASTSR